MSTDGFADPRVRAIRDFADWYRAKYGIQDWRDHCNELSGEMFGEFNELLFHSLVMMRFPTGAWQELCSGTSVRGEITAGVLQEIRAFFSRSPEEGNWEPSAAIIRQRVEECL